MPVFNCLGKPWLWLACVFWTLYRALFGFYRGVVLLALHRALLGFYRGVFTWVGVGLLFNFWLMGCTSLLVCLHSRLMMFLLLRCFFRLHRFFVLSPKYLSYLEA